MTTEMPVDILPIEFTKSRLEPGQTVTTSLYIRAPEQLGNHSIPLYFYYESPPLSDVSRIHHYRMIKMCYVIKVGASINVGASRSRPCLHDNNLCQTVLVAVNNASGTQVQQVHTALDAPQNCLASNKLFSEDLKNKLVWNSNG